MTTNFVGNDTDGDRTRPRRNRHTGGIIVTLYDDNGNITKTTTTDQNGNYVFDNLLLATILVIVGSGP
ncbi:MAG: hypothetical protein IPN94_23035 [Sphingobacteriales bacterium]|nr:hypothetical protein [Sphingobacteriales bacterium]